MAERRMHPLATLWLYTVLRFGLFAVLWGLLWLFGLRGLLGALVALVLSVPLSLVLLARPRARLAEDVTERVANRRMRDRQMDAELSGTDDNV
jgi:O-antigen ligase